MQKSGRPKRSRALQACEICRARKNRCNEEQPCSYCVEHDLGCVYSRPLPAKRRRVLPSKPGEYDITNFIPRQVLCPYVETPEPAAISNPGETLESVAGTRQDAPDSRFRGFSVRPSDAVQVPSPSESSARGQGPDRRREPASMTAPYAQSAGQTPLTTEQSAAGSRDSAADVMDTNAHTQNMEFYGAASSVAFLRHVEDISGGDNSEHIAGSSERSLASLLHNTNFLPYSTPRTLSGTGEKTGDRFCFRIARRFIEAYFSNIHHIQPIMDEETFLSRCEDLWFGKADKQPMSFIALYYVILSLGSLVMTWDDSEIYGAGRFSWSRRLFDEAAAIVTQLGAETDLEMAQCYYMMGKVCQHELNPHVAYMYSGQATRTALAIGLNRSAYGQSSDPASGSIAAKTWWAIYCLDIQTSFALGRPDSLGPDEYHTQSLPGVVAEHGAGSAETTPDVLQIIPPMVELSRIMRSVSLRLYTLPCTVRETAHRAKVLDAELSSWLRALPRHFQAPDTSTQMPSLKPRRPTGYINKQFVVLMIRYHNLRMIVHGKLLTVSEIEADMASTVHECQNQCIESAFKAIDLMYDTFRNDSFFQTWWYNSTYTLFAVSILLTAVFRGVSTSQQGIDSIFSHISRAIAVLEVMDECIVTRNATLIVKRTLARAEKAPRGVAAERQSRRQDDDRVIPQGTATVDLPPESTTELLQTDGLERNIEGVAPEDIDVDWMNASWPIDDGQQALFWAEWAHHLEDLGQ